MGGEQKDGVYDRNEMQCCKVGTKGRGRRVVACNVRIFDVYYRSWRTMWCACHGIGVPTNGGQMLVQAFVGVAG